MTSPPQLQIYQLGTFMTQAGDIIPNAFIAYKTWGNPKNPAIIYPTLFSGVIEDVEWQIGHDKALNPEKYFIVVPAMFGNGQSSSPSNTPEPYNGPRFPPTTYPDNVKAQYQLATEHLKLRSAHAVMGKSMGAGQTFQWAVQYPDFMKKMVAICGASRTSLHNTLFLRSLQATLRLDPEFNQGWYGPGKVKNGLRAFGRIYSSWGLSQTFYRRELFKQLGYPTLDSFLVGFWEASFLQKDPNNLLHMLDTWIAGDISKTPAKPFTIASGQRVEANFVRALGTIEAQALVMPGQTDLYFPPEDSEFEVSKMPHASLKVIPSVWGHFAASRLSGPEDVAWLDRELKEFLG